MKNEFILDGRLQSDLEFENEFAFYTISVYCGTEEVTTEDGETYDKNKLTFIRVISKRDLVKNDLRKGKYYRFIGKLDSEKYQTQSGKYVYNKILVVDKFYPLQRDFTTGEVYVVEEEK